jgi:hypothetical protein
VAERDLAEGVARYAARLAAPGRNSAQRNGAELTRLDVSPKETWTSAMKAFLNSIGLQNLLLFLTLFAAICIGRTQNQINTNLLTLAYSPQIELSYEQQKRTATVHNVGKTQVCIYGVGPSVPDPNKPVSPDCISSGSSWNVPPGGTASGSPCVADVGPFPMFVFLKNQDEKRYTFKFLFFCEGTKVADNRGQSVGPITDWKTF